MSYYQIDSPNVIYEVLDSEVVIIKFDDGNYYHLSGSGAEIWEYLIKGFSTEQILEMLRQKHPTVKMQEEVQELINQLISENILQEMHPSEKLEITPLAPSNETFETPKLEKFTDMQELFLMDPIHDVAASGWPNQ